MHGADGAAVYRAKCSACHESGGALPSEVPWASRTIARQLVTEVERFRERAEIVTVPPLCPLAVSPYDFSRAGELIERAAAQTRGWLERGGLEKGRVPGALRPHSHADGSEACEAQDGDLAPPTGHTGGGVA